MLIPRMFDKERRYSNIKRECSERTGLLSKGMIHFKSHGDGSAFPGESHRRAEWIRAFFGAWLPHEERKDFYVF